MLKRLNSTNDLTNLNLTWHIEQNESTMPPVQFFSVALVHFSDQNWNSQNYSNLHIIQPVSHYLNIVLMLWHIQMMTCNCLLFPTLWIAYDTLIWMYYTGFLCWIVLPPKTSRHYSIASHHMQNNWTSYNISGFFWWTCHELMICSQVNLDYHWWRMN